MLPYDPVYHPIVRAVRLPLCVEWGTADQSAAHITAPHACCDDIFVYQHFALR